MNKLRLNDLDVRGRRVLVRVDFNVPLVDAPEGRAVGDDTRIRAAIPTIRTILERGGSPILVSHLGRPKGPDPKQSLGPVAGHLARLLGSPVVFVPDLVGEAAQEAVKLLEPGQVLLLENTRFDEREKKNDPALSEALARLADVFVNDAFGSAHRAHSTTEGVTGFVPQSAMGLLVEREVAYLSRLLGEPEQPFVGVLGGAKVSDKLGLIENLLGRVDALLIGGAMSYTFLRALGRGTGASLVEEDRLEEARALYERSGGRIQLPTDHVAAGAFAADAPHRIVRGDIPDGLMGVDIGPATLAAYRGVVLGARTVVWNGPMGVFEMEPFAKGTMGMAHALADATDAGAMTVVGGGDSVSAVVKSGMQERVSHVSTGGGAMLEFLEGKTLPGIAALTDAD
jgi:phosphoglycerate kinase